MILDFMEDVFAIPDTPVFGIEYYLYLENTTLSFIAAYDYDGSFLEWSFKEVEG